MISYPMCDNMQVTVVTSDVRFAGTTADVFAEFEGEAGSFGPEALESSSNNFARGRRDDFVLRAPDVGTILKVRIWHANNAITGSDWHLQVCATHCMPKLPVLSLYRVHHHNTRRLHGHEEQFLLLSSCIGSIAVRYTALKS